MDSAAIIDGGIVLGYLALTVALGLYVGRRNTTLAGYATGGRSVGWWAVLGAIIAAETSAATFLGAPAESYKSGTYLYAQLVIGTILARIIIAYIFLRPYYRYGVHSIYELLQLRFGVYTRNMASAIFIVARVLGIGVRLYLGGVIFAVVWRYLYQTEPQLIHYIVGIASITMLTALYTALGGIKAVVYTEGLQALLMMSSAIFAVVALWQGVSAHPTEAAVFTHLHWGSFFSLGYAPGDDTWTAIGQVLSSPYTIFSAVIASTFFTLSTHGCDQDMVQRMLTAKNVKESRRSLILSGLADVPVVLLFLTIGILLAAHYRITPDPTLPAAPNEVFAHYIVTAMPVGLRGLVIAGVLATMMGSTSAALNALATSFTKDFYLPYLAKRGISEEQKISAARRSTFVFALLMIIVASVAAYQVMHRPELTVIPIALGVLGCTYGALLGVFLLAVLTKTRGNDQWNIVAMLGGIIAVLVLGRVKMELGFASIDWGAILPPSWPAIAWPWYVMVGCLATLAIGIWGRQTPAIGSTS